MSQITTHVLDTALGRPAQGVPISLEFEEPDREGWDPVADGVTNADGRIGDLTDDVVAPGRYRITFDTEAYFAATGQTAFFPSVALEFWVAAGEQYHVPLLLSPYGVSSYRGS
ncbi:hydroxyisourate hydrolase [Marisediminicola senii]|uniref:hydroxyisourate hydrolase n=1 Tax=Marisediminicola senii TaxID=2711233 RepID=UPI0013EDA7AF|nr:hydroxyisourate hydrolase [Marisediminicola senii]